MADSIWWTKMLHKEDFCEHFCEMSDKEIVEDIRKSIASFMKQREEGEDFGAKMVHKAKLRIDAVHYVRSDAGKQGGRPRKETTADGDIREDSLENPDGSAITRNETRAHDALEPSANHYGDAATSDGAEVCPNRESGVVAPTTISEFSVARESTRTDGHSLIVGNVACPPVRSGRNSRCPNSREEFHAFVADNNLHEGLAEEWYAMHEARGWVDENGNPIKNWRGALYNYCTKTELKRRTA